MKSLEALLRGYLLFRAFDPTRGGRSFHLTYARAKAAMPKTGPAGFDGWHIWKGWQGFYQRLEAPPRVQPTISASAGFPAEMAESDAIEEWQTSAEL